MQRSTPLLKKFLGEGGYMMNLSTAPESLGGYTKFTSNSTHYISRSFTISFGCALGRLIFTVQSFGVLFSFPEYSPKHLKHTT